jgi:hypothetical protein
MENTDYLFYFKNIPDETALTEALKGMRFPLTAEIRQGEEQPVRTANGTYWPVHAILDANSMYELNAMLENGKADGWLKDMPVTMICEEWEEEDLGPEPSLSAAERNPSMVGK